MSVETSRTSRADASTPTRDPQDVAERQRAARALMLRPLLTAHGPDGDDFRLVQELGVDYLRYGPPYYRTHLGPGRYDWAFADETAAVPGTALGENTD